MTTNPVPGGYHSVTPYLVVKGAAALIDFLKQVFLAEELMRIAQPDGAVHHAEVRIGDSVIKMGEPPAGAREMPAALGVYVPDVDAVYERALSAGATSFRAPADQQFGERLAGVRDQFGNEWWIATRI